MSEGVPIKRGSFVTIFLVETSIICTQLYDQFSAGAYFFMYRLENKYEIYFR